MIVTELEQRRARRAYSSEEIPDEVIERVLFAAGLAPSCSNKQPWRFLVHRSGPSLDKARAALSSGNYWALKAPVLITVLTKDDDDCRLSDNRDYALFDSGQAVMALQLQAVKEGLVAHPMAGFDPLAIRSSFSIDPADRVVTMVSLGYSGDDSQLNERHLASETSPRTRKALDEFVSYNP